MIIEKDELRKQSTSAMGVESPPPYHRDRENSDKSSALSHSSSDRGPREMPPAPPYPESANVQTVSKISIHKLREPISGTYCISSDVPGDDKALSQGGMGNGFSKKLGPRFNWFTTPDASFRTRYGAIYLDLSTGHSTTHDVRSTANVTNRLGDVAIDVSYIDPTNHLNLDVHSHRGNIVVLLPRNYCGPVQLSCSRGGYTILPEVANATRIMQGKGGKVFIHIGENSYSGSDNASAMDHCRLSAKFGQITLGFSGSNANASTQKAGNLWQRMGFYLRAGSERAGPR